MCERKYFTIVPLTNIHCQRNIARGNLALKTKLCKIYYKVDTESILNMFVFDKNIVHFAKLRILPDRQSDNEHDISIYFARSDNELIVCVIKLNFLLQIAITQGTGRQLKSNVADMFMNSYS